MRHLLSITSTPSGSFNRYVNSTRNLRPETLQIHPVHIARNFSCFLSLIAFWLTDFFQWWNHFKYYIGKFQAEKLKVILDYYGSTLMPFSYGQNHNEWPANCQSRPPLCCLLFLRGWNSCFLWNLSMGIVITYKPMLKYQSLLWLYIYISICVYIHTHIYKYVYYALKVKLNISSI